MHLSDRLRSVLRPIARPLARALRGGLFVRPGHFYSPIVDVHEAARHLARSKRAAGAPIEGIEIDRTRHLAFWDEIQPLLRELPFGPVPKAGLRYGFDNDAFGYGDGIMLYAILRHFRPRRLIEVGSGYSSACSLDTIERFLGGTVETTFIEPHPALLERFLSPAERARSRVLAVPIQEVEPALFDQLEAGDVLFIDSTHVAKTGSDVVFELFEVLPRLRPGVLIHFHDIFDGFEYPAAWVLGDNRSWNELYILRAYLMYNRSFEVVFFNDFFARTCAEEIQKSCPLFQKNSGGSLWLRKRA
jgi:hypothetical protein